MNHAQQIKQRLLPQIKEACQHLLPKGHFDGTNWRVGSIKGEPGSSLSVVCGGPRAGCWKDFAASDDHQGDIFKLWMMVRRVPFPDALDEAEIWLERGATALPMPVSANSLWQPETHVYIPAQMPKEVAFGWQLCTSFLARHADIQNALDQLRGWPPGTTAMLAQRQLVGLIFERPQPAWAFAVQFPINTGCMTIGYHARPVDPGAGQKAAWTYRPTARLDRVAIPAVPFVLGAEEIHDAKLIVVLEGQWDAVTWAATAGWLSRWPRHVTVFGVRGATSWRPLLTHWGQLWPRSAKILLVPDGDDAGQQWRGEFARCLGQRAAAVQIFDTPAGQDFSDLNQREHFTPTAIADSLARHGLVDLYE